MRRVTITAATLAFLTAAPCARAQWAVIDGSNLVQNTTTALKTVQMSLTQVQQYQTQLNQYRLQIMNATGLAQAAQIYQQYARTMQQLTSLYQQLGNPSALQNYLNQFQNVNYWTNVPAANFPATAAASQTQNSLTQKQANDAWAQALQQHQQLLTQDAAALTRAESNAQTAQGQLQAIQASAQLNAAVAKQLMEIHALLVQEQQALQARQGSQANDEAMRQAASAAYASPTYVHAPVVSYAP